MKPIAFARFALSCLMAILLFAGAVWAAEPRQSFQARGGVLDMQLHLPYFSVSTDRGTLETFHIDTPGAAVQVHQFDQFRNFMGKLTDPKVYSLDLSPDGTHFVSVVQGNLLALVNSETGERRILNPALQGHYLMRQAAFLDNDHIVLALLSNEFVLYQISTGEVLYRVSTIPSAFAHFELDPHKERIVASNESGVIQVMDARTGEIQRELRGGNLNNVFRVDLESGFVFCAGQDMQAALYDIEDGSYRRYPADFPVYSAGLSANAERGAYAWREDNSLRVIDLPEGREIAILEGHHATVNAIRFLPDGRILSGGDETSIYLWEKP